MLNQPGYRIVTTRKYGMEIYVAAFQYANGHTVSACFMSLTGAQGWCRNHFNNTFRKAV